MADIAALATLGEGRCSITGVLTLESVPGLWKQLMGSGLLGNTREADLTGITDGDSAGLAMLVAWRAHRLAAGGTLAFEGLPPRILALARLTSAEAALGA
jgi:ABC-type transporter Mla MlaB component